MFYQMHPMQSWSSHIITVFTALADDATVITTTIDCTQHISPEQTYAVVNKLKS